MAIKKIFIFSLLLLLLFTFTFSCFGAKYYTPTEEEFQILIDNLFFHSSFTFDNDSLSTIVISSFSPSEIVFPSPSSSQFFFIYVNPQGNMFCYPVQFTDISYHGFNFSLFGVNLDLYNESLFVEPGCDMGLSFLNTGDWIYCSLVRDKSFWLQSGEVVLSYLPKSEISFDGSIKNSLSFLISGIGEMTSSFISPGQPLFVLMQLLLLGISITFLFFAVKIIRRFVWGD